MEISAVNLDELYSSLQGIIRPPLERFKRPSEAESDPLILVGVKEACYWAARVFGWTFRGSIPTDVRKAVVIFAPHTSQVDFVLGMAAYRHFSELQGYYLAKKELFKGPFKWLFEKTGGIPVDRSRPNNLVEEVASIFEGAENMFLGLAPEGTRSYTRKWRSGFYRIAMEARVPILMAYLDFSRKEAGIGEILYPSGDYEADARRIEDFYKNKTPFFPDKWNCKVT